MNKLFSILTGTVLLVCLQAGCANTPATADHAVKKAPLDTAHASRFPELKVGMTAALVRAQLGDPVEIRPMESTIGKAEVWVFHIERTVDTVQVATGTRSVPAFTITMSGPGMVNVPEPVYSLMDKKEDTTLSLLMLNGRLIAQTSAVRDYNQYK